jgi:hypothetical protein
MPPNTPNQASNPPKKDYVKLFGERLKKLNEGIQTMKNFGLDEEILICWLRVKTGLSLGDIKLMLRSQEEFYEKLKAKGICDLI